MPPSDVERLDSRRDREAHLTSSLEDALKKDKEINKTQRQFVSPVSHEFRTPLAIIDGQAQ